jgi:hypothetical protein
LGLWIGASLLGLGEVLEVLLFSFLRLYRYVRGGSAQFQGSSSHSHSSSSSSSAANNNKGYTPSSPRLTYRNVDSMRGSGQHFVSMDGGNNGHYDGGTGGGYYDGDNSRERRPFDMMDISTVRV